jgi:AcrR family transcriptional regulator
MAANNKKIELILTTYQLLQAEELDNITIRKIASTAGCTSGTIYRHFNDLDDLISIASVKFLENYIVELQKLANEDTDPIEMNNAMWEVFVKEAFQNVDIFLFLFFGKCKDTLTEKIFEYYQLFPDKWRNMGGLFTSIFFHNNLEERITIMMTHAASIKKIRYQDIHALARLQCHLFHGLLCDYKSTYRLPGKPEEAVQIFMDTLNSLNEHYSAS